MPPHPLTNFEVYKYCQNKPKFNGAYLINNLSKIKDGTYIINLHEYESIETPWITWYLNAKNVIYLNSFGVEHIQKNRKIIRAKNIMTNIYGIQAHDSIMCGYVYVGFTDFMLKGKILLEYTNIFS